MADLIDLIFVYLFAGIVGFLIGYLAGGGFKRK